MSYDAPIIKLYWPWDVNAQVTIRNPRKVYSCFIHARNHRTATGTRTGHEQPWVESLSNCTTVFSNGLSQWSQISRIYSQAFIRLKKSTLASNALLVSTPCSLCTHVPSKANQEQDPHKSIEWHFQITPNNYAVIQKQSEKWCTKA